jgi:membrane-bound serine protease (ClpP class)
MEFLLDANVSYVLLVVGMLLALMALLTPGTGLFEISALFALVLAGYGAYNLGVNAWALVPLALAVVPFLYAVRVPRWRTALLAATILLVMGGSILLFPGKDGGLIGVNPLLAGFVSLAASGLLWLFVERTLAVMTSPPAHGAHHLIGKIGEARTDINDEGSVQVSSELWSARSSTPIPAGSKVRIVGKEGLVLIVEIAH